MSRDSCPGSPETRYCRGPHKSCTHGHEHRPGAGESELAEVVKVLAPANPLMMIWTRQRQVNQLCRTLRELYPGALVAFEDLASPHALGVLDVAGQAMAVQPSPHHRPGGSFGSRVALRQARSGYRGDFSSIAPRRYPNSLARWLSRAGPAGRAPPVRSHTDTKAARPSSPHRTPVATGNRSARCQACPRSHSNLTPAPAVRTTRSY